MAFVDLVELGHPVFDPVVEQFNPFLQLLHLFFHFEDVTATLVITFASFTCHRLIHFLSYFGEATV